MILNWRAKAPGEKIEFMSTIDADRLAETLIAFANSGGGTIIAGVDQSGQVVEDLMFEDVEDALRQALAQGRPMVRTEWQRGELRGRTIVAINVPRSNELHSLQDGRVLVRSGTENRPLGGDEIVHLAATKSSGDFETVPLGGLRRTIAERMTLSYQSAPHITLTVEADTSALEALRAELNARAEAAGEPRLSVTAILVKACAWALMRHPWANASLPVISLFMISFPTPQTGRLPAATRSQYTLFLWGVNSDCVATGGPAL